jgi:phosphotransferase system IIB component
MGVQAEGKQETEVKEIVLVKQETGVKGVVLVEGGQVIQGTRDRNGNVRVRRLKKDIGEVLDAWRKKGYTPIPLDKAKIR